MFLQHTLPLHVFINTIKKSTVSLLCPAAGTRYCLSLLSPFLTVTEMQDLQRRYFPHKPLLWVAFGPFFRLTFYSTSRASPNKQIKFICFGTWKLVLERLGKLAHITQPLSAELGSSSSSAWCHRLCLFYDVIVVQRRTEKGPGLLHSLFGTGPVSHGACLRRTEDWSLTLGCHNDKKFMTTGLPRC